MKLKDVLELEIDAKLLAKVCGLSARQIRKLRAGGRQIPYIDLSPEQVESMLTTCKDRHATEKARDAWYLAETELLQMLQETNRLEKAAESVVDTTHQKELLELYQQFDTKIQAALKVRGLASREAQKLGVKAIWLPRGKEIDILLARHTRRLNDVHDELEKPSELMRRRITHKLAVA